MNKKVNDYVFRWAAYSSIISIIIILLILLVLGVSLIETNTLLSNIKTSLYVIVNILSIVTLCGYLKISRDERIRSLEICSLIIFPILLISPVLNVWKSAISSDTLRILTIILLILSGIIYLAYGSILRRINEKTIKFSSTLGVLYIAAGVLQMSIILSFLTLFINIVLATLEAKMFFWKAKGS
jgi:hypothetical protein